MICVAPHYAGPPLEPTKVATLAQFATQAPRAPRGEGGGRMKKRRRLETTVLYSKREPNTGVFGTKNVVLYGLQIFHGHHKFGPESEHDVFRSLPRSSPGFLQSPMRLLQSKEEEAEAEEECPSRVEPRNVALCPSRCQDGRPGALWERARRLRLRSALPQSARWVSAGTGGVLGSLPPRGGGAGSFFFGMPSWQSPRGQAPAPPFFGFRRPQVDRSSSRELGK